MSGESLMKANPSNIPPVSQGFTKKTGITLSGTKNSKSKKQKNRNQSTSKQRRMKSQDQSLKKQALGNGTTGNTGQQVDEDAAEDALSASNDPSH